MADLPESNEWTTGIYQLETSDPVLGGPEGIDNLQAKQLANRTRWLKDKTESLGVDLAGKATKATTLGGYGITDAFTKPETTSAIQQAIASLVASSPAALDTLKELADALGNDPNFATTITAQIASKAAKATTLNGYGITDAYNKVDTEYLIGQAVLPFAKKASTLAGYGITDAFTQAQTNTAIQAAVTALVASSPAALDTLKELATALGNDPNFATTMTNALAGKAAKATTLGGYGITDAFTKAETYSRTDTEYLISQSVTALLPKRSFTVNDFIRIPDVPGGLILQMGTVQVGPETTVDITLPITFNTGRGAIAGVAAGAATNQGNFSAYASLQSNSTIRITQDVSTSSAGINQYIHWLAWGN